MQEKKHEKKYCPKIESPFVAELCKNSGIPVKKQSNVTFLKKADFLN